MVARIVELRTKSGKARDLSGTLKEKVLPILQAQPGFVDEIMLVSNSEPDKVLALSFWQSEADAERYNREQFHKITGMITSFAENAPKVQNYNVEVSTVHNAGGVRAA